MSLLRQRKKHLAAFPRHSLGCGQWCFGALSLAVDLRRPLAEIQVHVRIQEPDRETERRRDGETERRRDGETETRTRTQTQTQTQTYLRVRGRPRRAPTSAPAHAHPHAAGAHAREYAYMHGHAQKRAPASARLFMLAISSHDHAWRDGNAGQHKYIPVVLKWRFGYITPNWAPIMTCGRSPSPGEGKK